MRGWPDSWWWRDQLYRWRYPWLARETTGQRGEREARHFLRKAGYGIIAANLRLRVGEIDLLVEPRERNCLVLVEVKSRQLKAGHDDKTLPEWRVGSRKQRKLQLLASQLIKQYRLRDRPIRLDVVGVDLPVEATGQAAVRHYPCAFESRY